MFNCIRSLFGSGKILAEITDTRGGEWKLRVPYTGDPDTFDMAEFREEISSQMRRQHGAEIDEIHITSFPK